jgi:hypothetical protein
MLRQTRGDVNPKCVVASFADEWRGMETTVFVTSPPVLSHEPLAHELSPVPGEFLGECAVLDEHTRLVPLR